MKVAQLPAADRAAIAPLLRSNNSALLAESLLDNNPAPILAKHSIRLSAAELERAEHIATLPELLVTPPEEATIRRAERGEKRGRR
jgi:hypothetical protein